MIRYESVCTKCGETKYGEEKTFNCPECGGGMISAHLCNILDQETIDDIMNQERERE